MKRIIVAIVALMATIGVSAQDLRYGVVGGVNFSWERGKVGDVGVSSDSYIGFQAGVKAEMDLASYITDGLYAE